MNLQGVMVSGMMEKQTGTTDTQGYVVFTFAWATADGSAPAGNASVDFFLDLESSDVEFTDAEDTFYTHSNATSATEVRILQHFASENLDPEVRFTLTASPGTPQEESLEGTLGFDDVPEAEGQSEKTAMDFWPWMLGALLLGALLGALVVSMGRKPRAPPPT